MARLRTPIRYALIGVGVALGWMIAAVLFGTDAPAAHADTTPGAPPVHHASSLVGTLTDGVTATAARAVTTVGSDAARLAHGVASATTKIPAAGRVVTTVTHAASPVATPVTTATTRVLRTTPGAVGSLTAAVSHVVDGVVDTAQQAPVIGSAVRALGVGQTVDAATSTIDHTVSALTNAVADSGSAAVTGITSGTGLTVTLGTPDGSVAATAATGAAGLSQTAMAATTPIVDAAAVASSQDAFTGGEAWGATVPMVAHSRAAAIGSALVTSTAPQNPFAPAGTCVASGVCAPGAGGAGLTLAAMGAAGFIFTRRGWMTLRVHPSRTLLPALPLAPDVRPG